MQAIIRDIYYCVVLEHRDACPRGNQGGSVLFVLGLNECRVHAVRFYTSQYNYSVSSWLAGKKLKLLFIIFLKRHYADLLDSESR